jgi:hypothetical protein
MLTRPLLAILSFQIDPYNDFDTDKKKRNFVFVYQKFQLGTNMKTKSSITKIYSLIMDQSGYRQAIRCDIKPGSVERSIDLQT